MSQSLGGASAVKAREIPQALDEQDKCIAELRQIVEVLEARLAPVLSRPEPKTTDAEKSATMPPNDLFVDRIRIARQEVNRISSNLHNIISRLHT